MESSGEWSIGAYIRCGLCGIRGCRGGGDGPSEPLESDPVVTREYTPFPFSELPDPSRADRSFLYLRKSTTLRLSLATTLAIRL